MHNYSPTKGRRKVVEKFTIREGLLNVGTGRSDLDGNSVAVLVWVSECRHALSDSFTSSGSNATDYTQHGLHPEGASGVRLYLQVIWRALVRGFLESLLVVVAWHRPA